MPGGALGKHHTLEQRLARLILTLYFSTPDPALQMTQERLSRLLGVRREGVTLAALRLSQPGSALRIEQQGFCDTVVWNPGPAKGAALADLEPDGDRHLLCVEAAVVGRPVSLAPGAHWQGSQTLIIGG